jgi:carboxypeptidase C (cathepsin A)
LLSFWTSSGGPGCSGLIGFFTEHGPYRVDADLQLHENPYAWNQMANIFFVEQPAGVGFSIVDAADGHKTSDAQSAVDNYQLIRAFFQRFPERQKNPFYLASESVSPIATR